MKQRIFPFLKFTIVDGKKEEVSFTSCIPINQTNRDYERVIMISNGAGFYPDLIGWARSRDVIIRGGG